MKIIAVEGKSNIGKSTVIKNTIKDLITNENFQVEWMRYSYIGRNPVDVIDERWFTNKHNVSDIRILLNIKGKTICIVSVGDSVKQIIDAYNRTMKHCSKTECDLFVCACHPNSPARKKLDDLAKPDIVCIVNKTSINHDVQDELKNIILKTIL